MNLPLLIQITMIASLDEGLMSNTFFPNNSNRREICVCVCVYSFVIKCYGLQQNGN